MIWERLETRSQKLEKRIPEEGRIFTEKCPVFENQEKKCIFSTCETPLISVDLDEAVARVTETPCRQDDHSNLARAFLWGMNSITQGNDLKFTWLLWIDWEGEENEREDSEKKKEKAENDEEKKGEEKWEEDENRV